MAQKTSNLWNELLRMNDTYREYGFDVGGVWHGPDEETSHDTESVLYEDFGIGNATISKLSLSLFSDEIPRAATIKRYVRLVNGDKISEWIPKGVFFTNTRKHEDGLWDIEAFDAMRKAETVWDVDPALSFPMKMTTAVSLIAGFIGVEIDSRTVLNTSYTITKPDGLTFRNVLQYIGAANGGNWIITDEGKLRLVPLISIPEESGYLVTEHGAAITLGGVKILVDKSVFGSVFDSTAAKHYVGSDLASLEDNGRLYAISRVTLITEDDSYITAGDDSGYEISADCPYATQSMVNDLLQKFRNYRYHAYDATAANLDPAAELGDGVTAGGIYSVISRISDDGSGYPDISAPGEKELEEEYPTVGPTSQEWDRKFQSVRKEIEDNSRELHQAVDNATNLITGNMGGYVVFRDSDGDGEPDEILVMDEPTIDTAKNIWRWNKSGLGHSTNGYDGPYGTAITQDGAIVASYITAGILTANLIRAGVLESLDGETFYLDLEKGVLRMKATELSIAGKSVSEIAKEAAGGIAENVFEDLTQEDIFNKLTDDGKIQGIYLKDGKIYVNATYIDTGDLSADRIKGGTISGVDIISRGLRAPGSVLLGEYVKLTDGLIKFMTSSYQDSEPSSEIGNIWADYYMNFFINSSNGVRGFKFFINDNSSGSECMSLTTTGYSSEADLALNGMILFDGTYTEYGIMWTDTATTRPSYGIGPNMSGNRCLGTNINGTLTAVSLSLSGSLTASGAKSRVTDTANYNRRLLYCYEMPSPMFGDIGEGETDESGECVIYLDDVFAETISTGIEYQVFLQKEGNGDIWISEKTPQYFIVRGTENLKFAWEIKAKQQGFEFERLESTERLETEPAQEIDYEAEYMLEIENLITKQEELLYEAA